MEKCILIMQNKYGKYISKLIIKNILFTIYVEKEKYAQIKNMVIIGALENVKILNMKYPLLTSYENSSNLLAVLGGHEKCQEWIYTKFTRRI